MGKVQINKQLAETIEILRKHNLSNSEIIGTWSYAQNSDSGVREMVGVEYDVLVDALENGYEVVERRQDVEGYTSLREILANPHEFIAQYAVIHANRTYTLGKIIAIFKEAGVLSVEGVKLALVDFGKTWDLLSNLTESELKELEKTQIASMHQEVETFEKRAEETKQWWENYIKKAKELYEEQTEAPAPEQVYDYCTMCDGSGYDENSGDTCTTCDGTGVTKVGEQGNCEPCNGTGVVYGFVCKVCNGLGDVESENEPTEYKTQKEILEDLYALAHAAVNTNDKKWFDEIHREIKNIKEGME